MTELIIDSGRFFEKQNDARTSQLINSKTSIIICFMLSVFLHALAFVNIEGEQAKNLSLTSAHKNIDIVLSPAQTPHHVEAIESIKKSLTPVPHKKTTDTLDTVKKTNKLPQDNQQTLTPQATATTSTQSSIDAETPKTSADIQDKAFLTSEKKRYLRRVIAHLEQYKFYPLSARRRQLEGEVKITFNLLANGSIQQLNLHADHEVLKRATADAIYHALPLPARPHTLDDLSDFKIEYSMRYSLSH